METVLIADDHELIRQGVRMIIESLPQKYHVIEASTVAEVIQALSCKQIQYAILDMTLPDGNILPAIQQNMENGGSTAILVYSMNPEKIYAHRLMQKGVRGFVNKQAPVEELEKAIRLLVTGDMYLSNLMTNELFKPGKPASSGNPIDTLSDRELEVVEYVALGMGAKVIAQRMNLDITTISTYRRRAFEKMDVQNVIELKDKFLLYRMQR